MAFDKPTRNRLAAFVGEARNLISGEFTLQFQRIYGISENGDIAPLEQLRDLDESEMATAATLRERIDYLVKSHPDDKDVLPAAVDRLTREQAFTVLNRLAAIRMAEKRGIIVESVGKGYQSQGFKVYEQVAGTGLRDTYRRYRRYLFCLFDELAVDLGVLFDRRSPQGLIFPREPALLKLFGILNAPDLDSLWAEDETIGWIYQYYNDPAERKKMREASSAPRNSRELAVRNQFFTPRYVVEFLTDNTLGRIWYEMTQGQTRLKEQCRYLVRRPNEIFLKPDEAAPEQPQQEDLSREELLKQPVYIPHRPIKDPREIRMLDPACGSMHFGLYAFDLYEVIYQEAWDLGMESIRRDYPNKGDLLREIPRLIIENNVHGIDIDVRAVQIAGLSLWLRAQRSWQQLKLRPQNRPQIMRSNIVCAEAMPGDETSLNEFINSNLSSTPEEKLLGQLVRRIFEAMKLAGEAGSLLKIDEEIAGAVAEAKQKWLAAPKIKQGTLFARPEQQDLVYEVSGITDEAFWGRVEDLIYSSLQDYAEKVDHPAGFRRRLFAEDAVRGFAFVDICRKRYDVALMNPPFGDSAIATRSYIDKQFPDSTHDICAAFVERGLGLLARGGSHGAITTRTCLFIQTFAHWREKILHKYKLNSVADLGYGVLDAMVETAAYIIEYPLSQDSKRSEFFGVLADSDKAQSLAQSIESNSGFQHDQALFLAIPEFSMAYWLPDSLAKRFSNFPSFISSGGKIRVGIQSGDDFRFFRLAWEIPRGDTSTNIGIWIALAKGGEYSPWWDDPHLAVLWKNNGEEIRSHQSSRPQNTEYFFKEGLTYPYRTTSAFGLRCLPAGSAFSVGGWGVFPPPGFTLWDVLAIYNSRIARYFMEVLLGQGDSSVSGSAARNHGAESIGRIPWPKCGLSPRYRQLISDIVRLWRLNSSNETAFDFIPPTISLDDISISQFASTQWEAWLLRLVTIAPLSFEVEREINALYSLTSSEQQVIADDEGKHPCEYEIRDLPPEMTDDILLANIDEIINRAQASVGSHRFVVKKAFFLDRAVDLLAHTFKIHPEPILRRLVKINASRCPFLSVMTAEHLSLLFGSSLGRWDIHFATGDKSSPVLPDPFAPLPICPPGQLQNDQGLPITKEDVAKLKKEGRWNYPIEIPWDGILVDDPGHPLDIEARIQQVLQIIWKDHWEAIEREACEILGMKSLRDYFRKPSSFFADHLKRYSKSRRQAPIYWPLSSSKGSYTLWIYYHRLTDQTLHTALADFVDPKLKAVRSEIAALRESGNHRARLEELLDLEEELADFRNEIERIIKLPWKPNLNDGVLITASPLWKLFRLPKWQKDLKACWEKLEKGEYDWAHLAYSIWPKRVEEVCKTDRSIAIAHNLEHLCTNQPAKTKAKRGKRKAAQPEFDAMED